MENKNCKKRGFIYKTVKYVYNFSNMKQQNILQKIFLVIKLL